MTDPTRTHTFVHTPGSSAARQYTIELLPCATHPLNQELIGNLKAFLSTADAERDRIQAALEAQIHATETLEANGAGARAINQAYDTWRDLQNARDAHQKRTRDSAWLLRFYARVEELAAAGLDESWNTYVDRTQRWVLGDKDVPSDDFDRDAAAQATQLFGHSCVLQGWSFLHLAAS